MFSWYMVFSWISVWFVIFSGWLGGQTADSIWRWMLLKTVAAVTVSVWVSTGPLLYWDWLVTTPVTLVILWLLSVQGDGNRHPSGPEKGYGSIRPLAWLIVANLLMILAGWAASGRTGTTKWLLFSFSAVMLIWILVSFWRRDTNKWGNGLFGRLRGWTTIGWLVFPLLWLAGPHGGAWLDGETSDDSLWFWNGVFKCVFLLIVMHQWIRQPFTEQAAGQRGWSG